MSNHRSRRDEGLESPLLVVLHYVSFQVAAKEHGDIVESVFADYDKAENGVSGCYVSVRVVSRSWESMCLTTYFGEV